MPNGKPNAEPSPQDILRELREMRRDFQRTEIILGGMSASISQAVSHVEGIHARLDRREHAAAKEAARRWTEELLTNTGRAQIEAHDAKLREMGPLERFFLG